MLASRRRKHAPRTRTQFDPCSQSESSSYVHFRNNIFCAFVDTHTYYDRNYVFGKPNGSLAWQWNTRKSGGCTSLLSFHHIAAYT
jgi:hypothetical protein